MISRRKAMSALALLPFIKVGKSMTTVPLSESRTINLNGAGAGTIRISPLSAREVWHPENIHVSVSTNVNEATCNIYVGDSAIQANFRDGTFSGSSGDSSDRINADVIKMGSHIFAVWTGGDANAVATATVTGTKEL